MKSKAALNMPAASKYRLSITPFWLDLLFVSVANRLFLELNVNEAGLSVRLLLTEPMNWLISQLIIYTMHLLGAFLMPASIREDHPKAALLWSSLLAWILFSLMKPSYNA